MKDDFAVKILSCRGFGALALEMGASIASDGAGTDVAVRILAASQPRAVLTKDGRRVLVGIDGGGSTLSVAGTLAPIPVRTMPEDQANAAMEALEEGRVTGRIVLVEEAA